MGIVWRALRDLLKLSGFSDILSSRSSVDEEIPSRLHPSDTVLHTKHEKSLETILNSSKDRLHNILHFSKPFD